MTVVRHVKLFFQEGSSDKVYHATLLDEGGGAYSVEVEWGRRGSTLNRGRKAVKVPLGAAEKAFARLVREKTTKGYEELSEAAKPLAVAPPEGEGSGSRASGVRKRVGHSAQLLNGIDEDEAMAFLSDRRMIAQQKLDGNRVLVHVDEESFATNRAGQVTTIHASIFEGLSQLPRGTVVDGEVVGGADGPVYWLFDVLFVGTEDLRAHGYLARWDRLDGEIEPGVSGPVQVLECAHDPAAKRSLYERLRAARAEGIVFKDKDAPYKPGRPASGGAHFKHKFVKTADVVLTENVGNAYRMTVYDGKKVCQIGKVFSGTTNDSRQEIDRRLSEGEKLVAEVRYLYATADDQLFQPVFVRLRSDKKPSECFLSQLEKTSRDVHDV